MYPIFLLCLFLFFLALTLNIHLHLDNSLDPPFSPNSVLNLEPSGVVAVRGEERAERSFLHPNGNFPRFAFRRDNAGTGGSVAPVPEQPEPADHKKRGVGPRSRLKNQWLSMQLGRAAGDSREGWGSGKAQADKAAV